MDKFLQIVTLILISSVKFAFGIPFVYMNERYDFSWLQTNLYAVIGGMIGVVYFMYFSDWLMFIYRRVHRYFFQKKPVVQEAFTPPVADVDEPMTIRYEYIEGEQFRSRKIFTPRTRRIVRIWSKYGLIGLAALTPIFLSIPIGTFFITRLERSKRKILFYLFISISCWSLLLTTIFEYTHTRHIFDFFQ